MAPDGYPDGHMMGWAALGWAGLCCAWLSWAGLKRTHDFGSQSLTSLRTTGMSAAKARKQRATAHNNA